MASEILTLKEAFQKSRDEGNIEIVLPYFLDANFWVMTGGKDALGDMVFAAAQSPIDSGLCITVSENKEKMDSFAGIILEKMTGNELINKVPKKFGILIAYNDGGDYLSVEHLDWFREMLLK